MTIDELITKLRQIQATRGNLRVVVRADEEDYREDIDRIVDLYCVDNDRLVVIRGKA